MFDVTSLALMLWFDIVLGMVQDYMHGCLLGVTKTLLYKWLSSTTAVITRLFLLVARYDFVNQTDKLTLRILIS